jgi:hypothetical protein
VLIRGDWVGTPLAANSKPANQALVTLEVPCVKIIEQPAAFTDQSQKATTRMMVFRVRLEMLSELFDTRGEQCNLYFRRTTVVADAGIALDNFPSASGLEGHQVLILSFLFQLKWTITDR